MFKKKKRKILDIPIRRRSLKLWWKSSDLSEKNIGVVEKDSDEYRDVGCREHIVLVRRREKGRFEEKEGETTIQESKLRRLPRAGYRIDLSEPAKAPGTTRIPSYSSSLLILHANVQDTRDTRAQLLLYAIIYK